MLVLDRGEELIESLNDLAKADNLAGAWISGGVGGADMTTLSFYDIEARQYLDREFDESLEILNLSGNLAWVDGEPFWHVHGTLSGRGYQSIGGHVKKLRIGLTGEILITPLDTKLTRQYDTTTSLKLLTDQ